MKRQLILSLVIGILLMPLTMLAFQDDPTTFTFGAEQLISLLNPVVVFLAIELGKKISAINSMVILGVLVPGISLLGSWLLSLLVPELSFWGTFAIGFASTFIYELKKHLPSTS